MKTSPAHPMKVIPVNHRQVGYDSGDALKYAQASSPEQALRTLLEQVDAVVVVGGKNRNNTRRFLSTCRQTGTPSFDIERVGELSPAWFAGFERVGVTAGGSARRER
jgi:4-hydroxy-3-methylbut-2-enyl diphosphate reductase IspH